MNLPLQTYRVPQELQIPVNANHVMGLLHHHISVTNRSLQLEDSETNQPGLSRTCQGNVYYHTAASSDIVEINDQNVRYRTVPVQPIVETPRIGN